MDPTPTEQQQLREEFAKLGANGAERIRAVENYVRAQVGHDLAKDINTKLTTAGQILGWERVMANTLAQQRSAAASASAQSMSQQHREPPREPGRVSEEQFQKMSARDRLDYVRQFPQGQFQTV